MSETEELLAPTHGARLWNPANCLLPIVMVAGAGYWLLSGLPRAFGANPPCTSQASLLHVLSLGVFVTLTLGAILVLTAGSRLPRQMWTGILLPVATIAGWGTVAAVDSSRQTECKSWTLDEALQRCKADLRWFSRTQEPGYTNLTLISRDGIHAYGCLDRWERYQRGVAISVDTSTL